MFLQLTRLVARLNLASSQRVKSIRVPSNKSNIYVLEKLLQLGVIRGFHIIDDKIEIVLKYSENKTVFKRIYLMSRSSKIVNVDKIKFLKILNHNSSCVYLLSTSFGLKFTEECVLERLCGILLIKIVF
jgi:ribosomal protein S8